MLRGRHKNTRENTEKLKFQDCNNCLTLLHVDADAAARGIAIALLYLSVGALKIGSMSGIWQSDMYMIKIVILTDCELITRHNYAFLDH